MLFLWIRHRGSPSRLHCTTTRRNPSITTNDNGISRFSSCITPKQNSRKSTEMYLLYWVIVSTNKWNTWSNPLECRGNYNATSNDMKLVHWLLMGRLLHLVQWGGDWAGPQHARSHFRCTKCNSPPINGQCTNHHSMYNGPLLYGFNVPIKGYWEITVSLFLNKP